MNECLLMDKRERYKMCLSIILGCVRMRRGRSVWGGSSFRALLLSTGLSSSYLTTLLSHQSESRWLSEFWRCRMWNAKHPERSSQTLSYLSFIPAWRCRERLRESRLIFVFMSSGTYKMAVGLVYIFL